jgi:hypothetical protein
MTTKIAQLVLASVPLVLAVGIRRSLRRCLVMESWQVRLLSCWLWQRTYLPRTDVLLREPHRQLRYD